MEEHRSGIRGSSSETDSSKSLPINVGESSMQATIRLMGVELQVGLPESPSLAKSQPDAYAPLSATTPPNASTEDTRTGGNAGPPYAETGELRSSSDEGKVDKRGSRFKLTRHQTKRLEEAFRKSIRLSAAIKTELTTELGLNTRQVEIWFQNRRARTKLKRFQSEGESLLQLRSELLRENERLKNELEKLKLERSTWR